MTSSGSDMGSKSLETEHIEEEWSVIGETEGDTEKESAKVMELLRTELAVEHETMMMEPANMKAVLSVVAPAGEKARAPLRLVAVLDKSGSMGGEKLRLVKETMLFMLRQLSEQDALGIVEYDTHVKVTAPLTFCTAAGRLRLETALRGMRSGTQTNLSGGLLKGLELHGGTAQNVADAQPQTSLQRLSIGNTYRRLPEDQVDIQEHFGYPGSSPPNGAQRNNHEWTMMLRFDSPEDEALVEKVVFNLHESFRNPVVEVLEAPFQLQRKGWGTFAVFVDVHLKDGRIQQLQHNLSFDKPETFRTVLLPLRTPPAGLDYMVNGVKKVRVTSLRLENGASSSRNPDAEGQTLHMDGVSYGPWKAQRRTTVPIDQLAKARQAVLLFEGKGKEDRIEFTDTDGDHIAFVAPEGMERKAEADVAESQKADAKAAVVRSTFLFTDGLANIGITKAEDLCMSAQNALGELGDCRCTLSTFGFGKDHSADLLQALADAGNGTYSFVETEDNIGEAFGEALGGLLSTTHQNVTLSLELSPGVAFSRAFTHYQVDGPDGTCDGKTPQTVSFDLGDMYAEERRDILVELSLPHATTEGPQVLGQLHARGFSVALKKTEKSDPVELTVQRKKDCIGTGRNSHPQVERHNNRYVATEALKKARGTAKLGDLQAARRSLEAALDTLGKSHLAQAGDVICTSLVSNLNECLRDMKEEDVYRSIGSKKMAMMEAAHRGQRACTGNAEVSQTYMTSATSSMKARFKESCR
eukprot:TRINITY_DN9054_c0_g1_i1.p1 TRINITY_DN9054_c0_g1~~TRINITY_DN9054_c0_g1_i1.p1  ORF type:complete len:753 (+),score=169.00 TRINITY_DN9054_c0_g1_i1:102-2360(+)